MKQLFLTLVLGAILQSAVAQGTLQDYRRAYAVRTLFSSDSVMHWAHEVAWKDSTHLLHYRISTPQGQRYRVYDADRNTTSRFKP